jgi:hypothetical protein
MIKTISDLRGALQTHAADVTHRRDDSVLIQSIWNKLATDRRMPRQMLRKRNSRRNTRRNVHRGGAGYSLIGAPLEYGMTPGSAFTTNPVVAVYDRFPIDPTMNPQVVSDLDVFFGSALTRGCGIEDISLKVPADMGSNQVGGKSNRNRKTHRKIRGGAQGMPGFTNALADFGSGVSHHPYIATAYPNIAQSATNAWQGKLESVPTSSDPTNHTWKYSSEFPTKPVNVANWATSLGPSPYLMRVTAGSPVVARGGGIRKSRKGRNRRNGRKLSRRH